MKIKTLLSSFLLLLSPFSAFALPPIVFVTQPPHPQDFTTANSTFGNHLAQLSSIPRGGDLYIRYSDGSVRNLTRDAGYGGEGMLTNSQGIAVRDPSVHWEGNKILFSMVIGVPSKQYQVQEYRWQLYEMTSFQQNETPTIRKVEGQPPEYNNISPIYLSDDRILFTSDRPRNGAVQLYPQRDEYESAPTNSGLWVLNEKTTTLTLFDNAPSGDFSPSLDSFGRIIFTRWDHMQRDQQNGNNYYKPFNYSDESPNATALASDKEIFPEALSENDSDKLKNHDRHAFNHFFPWTILQDGTGLETLNHLGRHELHSYISRTFNDDSSIQEYYGQYTRANSKSIANFFEIRENPSSPGEYIGVDAPEFYTHAAGQLISVVAPPSLEAGKISVQYLTPRSTSSYSATPPADHTGLYRDPLPLSTGELLAVHTNETRQDKNVGTTTSPKSLYSFRVKLLEKSGSYFTPSTSLTSGIKKTIKYWGPDELVTYSDVELWELQPVEVRVRPRPPVEVPPLPSPEQQVFNEVNVSPEEFQQYLKQYNLALIVSRDVTTRDSADIQQPFNLQVEGSSRKSIGDKGKVYPISFLQLLQGDYLRGYVVGKGRRVLAQPLHEGSSFNQTDETLPEGSVKIASDGSIAAFVPATRPLTWHLTDSSGASIVKERYWLTFQPGEIRVCSSCHGLSDHDQMGRGEPQNAPEALKSLLLRWKEKKNLFPTPLPTIAPTARTDPTPPTQDKRFKIRLLPTKKQFKGGTRVNILLFGPVDDKVTLTLSSTGERCKKEFQKRLKKGKARQSISLRAVKKNRIVLAALTREGTLVRAKTFKVLRSGSSTKRLCPI